jgi:hypothetical protein
MGLLDFMDDLPIGVVKTGICRHCKQRTLINSRKLCDPCYREYKESKRATGITQDGGAKVSGDSSARMGPALQIVGFLFGFIGLCSIWIAFCNQLKIPTGDGSPLQTSAMVVFLVIAGIFRKLFGKAAVFLFVIAVIAFIVAVALKMNKGG